MRGWTGGTSYTRRDSSESYTSRSLFRCLLEVLLLLLLLKLLLLLLLLKVLLLLLLLRQTLMLIQVEQLGSMLTRQRGGSTSAFQQQVGRTWCGGKRSSLSRSSCLSRCRSSSVAQVEELATERDSLLEQLHSRDQQLATFKSSLAQVSTPGCLNWSHGICLPSNSAYSS